MPYATQYRVHAPVVEALIEEIELGSDQASAEFGTDPPIPQIYSELRIEVVARSTRSAAQDAGQIRFGNGTIDTGSNYDSLARGSGGADNEVNGGTSAYIGRFAFPAASSTADLFGMLSVKIPQYASAKQKVCYADGGFIDGTNDHLNHSVARWASTSAIDIINIFPLNGPNWAAGSVFRLYGIGPT